jgi:hypothetical protein
LSKIETLRLALLALLEWHADQKPEPDANLRALNELVSTLKAKKPDANLRLALDELVSKLKAKKPISAEDELAGKIEAIKAISAADRLLEQVHQQVRRDLQQVRRNLQRHD